MSDESRAALNSSFIIPHSSLLLYGDLRVGGGVPEFHVPVEAARGERASVGREGDGSDRALVAFELHQLLERDCAPKAHGLVRASGGDGWPVGREGYRPNRALVARERVDPLAPGQVVDYDLAVV